MLPAFWYDFFYEQTKIIDYEQDVEVLSNLFLKYHPSAKTILDIACGTGEHAKSLSRS
jgi:ubiquinone/menaquinone biosynthesis C-methylase UbiE